MGKCRLKYLILYIHQSLQELMRVQRFVGEKKTGIVDEGVKDGPFVFLVNFVKI